MQVQILPPLLKKEALSYSADTLRPITGTLQQGSQRVLSWWSYLTGWKDSHFLKTTVKRKVMNAEQIFEAVTKLTGSVHPIGESTVDADRLENMKKFISVFDRMHFLIYNIATKYKDSPQHSEKQIGQLCHSHIESMWITE